MEPQPLIRVIGMITTSQHKITEVTNWLNQYGIAVVQLPTDTNYINYLMSNTPKLKILCVLKEQTYLYKKNTKDLAEKKHLELVSHISVLKCYTYDPKEHEINTQTLTESTDGYIDITMKKSDDKNKYDWDDIFVVDNLCHRSYRDLALNDIKISSRDKNISKIIELLVHYKTRADLIHNPQHYNNTIDFSRSVHDYVKSIEEFNNEYMKKFNLNNILTVAINQGAFFRASTTRRQKLYWCPGLNAGIPLTPKPKDRLHELTFQIHDFTHMTIPDLAYEGTNSLLAKKMHLNNIEAFIKKVYIVSRLASEALTLVMADMMYVTSLKKSGIKYQTVNQRKIYPIFEEIEKKNPNFEKNLEPFICNLLEGSFDYCFFKDTTTWSKLMEDTSVLKDFSGKYDAYFIDDFNWTLHNYEDMKRRPLVFSNWWNSVQHWRKLGVNLELQSVSEFILEYNLYLYEDNQEKLLKTIFKSIYDKYIKKMFTTKNIEVYCPQHQLTNAFIRYMIGQSIIFFQHWDYPESKITFNKINEALHMENIYRYDIKFINSIRQYYNNYLKKLEMANLITPDDRINYEQVCPIFSPLIVNYNNKDELTQEFVNNIIN